MIDLLEYKARFELFLQDTALKLTNENARPSVIGLLFDPGNGMIAHSIHFHVFDAKHAIALTEYDMPLFTQMEAAEWAENFFGDQRGIRVGQEIVLESAESNEDYNNAFVDFFTPIFSAFWKQKISDLDSIWLSIEALTSDPYAHWKLDEEVPDLYPASIFIPGPPLKREPAVCEQPAEDNNTHVTQDNATAE